MTLSIDVRKTLGTFSLDAQFDGSDGVTALFGRSGAGKTSIIQMIAGLTRPDDGRILLDGIALFDSKAGIDIAPEKRRVGYVFQDARLFPHMNVRRNLEYGARRNGRNGTGFGAVVDTLGLSHLLDRRPGDLSGGERQRVAIGRALLASPRLLLMDEPLASLDAERKAEIIPFIERLRRDIEIPILYVSHAIDEILQLADRMVLVDGGRIAAAAPLEDVLNRPDLARLAGDGDTGSVIAVEVTGRDDAYGVASLAFPGGTFRVDAPDLSPGDRIRIRVRARDVSLILDRPRNVSVMNIFAGTVTEIAVSDGRAGSPHVDVGIDIGGTRIWSRITRKSCDDLGLAPGVSLYAMVKAVAIDRPAGRP